MREKVLELDRELAGEMDSVDSMSPEEKTRKLFDGTFITKIETFINNHPELTQFVMNWLLSMIKTSAPVAG